MQIKLTRQSNNLQTIDEVQTTANQLYNRQSTCKSTAKVINQSQLQYFHEYYMTYNNLKSTPYSAKSYKTLIGLIIQSKKNNIC